MGLSKLTRGLGKVGLAVEGVAYLAAAGRTLFAALRPRSTDPVADDAGEAHVSASEQRAAD
jgi:hypothetical protein